MFKVSFYPLFCTAESCCCQAFENLNTLMAYPDLALDEKALWIYLATDCAKNLSPACSYSYRQLSLVMNQSCKEVHRALFRLMLTGFLRADLPIWYAEPTQTMCEEVRSLIPTIPAKELLNKLSALKQDERYIINLSHLKNPKRKT